MKRFYLWIMLMTLWGMSARLYAATDSGQLQATHMGYYDDGTYTWYLYINDNEYYAKCYLGASTVTAPEWVSSVTTIPYKVTLTDGNTKIYKIPTVLVFEDHPSDKYLIYKYVDSSSKKTCGKFIDEDATAV